MVGAGVFTTSGFSLGSLGNRSTVLLAWFVGGLIGLCGAVSYGRLARQLTESGGEYLYLARKVHPVVGFIAGWVSMLAGFTGAIALAATAFSKYFASLSPALTDTLSDSLWGASASKALAVGVIVVFGLLHCVAIRSGLWTQNLVVIGKLVALLCFVAFAYWVALRSGWAGQRITEETTPFLLSPTSLGWSSVSAFAGALVWISLSYSGFNAAIYVSGEVRQAERNVPRALILGTLVVFAIYLLLNHIFLFAPRPDDIAGQEAVAAIAAESLGGSSLRLIVSIAICLGLLSSVSSMIIAGPRVYAKMADDGVLPSIFRPIQVAGSLRIPVAAIWLQVVLACIVVLVAGLDDLLGYLGFTLSLSAAGTVACNLLDITRPRNTRFDWFVFLASFVFVSMTVLLAVLAAWSQPVQFAAAIATMATGVLAYRFLPGRGVKRT